MAKRPPVEKLEQMPITELIPYARNARTHSDVQVQQIAASIREFGFLNPVLIDEESTIIAGHGRVLAAHVLELDRVPCRRIANLTAGQKQAYVIADNQLAMNAGWDRELLGVELSDLKLAEFDLDLLAFDPDELKEIMGVDDEPPPEDVPAQTDRADELQQEWKTETGQLWTIKGQQSHRLLCGDATDTDDVDGVLDGAVAEMLFTDPPYGVSYTGGIQFDGQGGAQTNGRKALAGDETTEVYSKFLPVVLPRVSGPCYLWFADTKALPVYQAVEEAGGVVSALLIWHKTNATYAAMNAQYKQRHEPCLYFKTKGATLRWCGPTTAATLWEFPRDPVNDLHPTQKPTVLAWTAISHHKAETVLDCFLGSGTTMLAAEQLNRRCYGMEISPAYCAVILQRMKDAGCTCTIE